LENNNKKADLHIHTYFSDGTFTPTEVVNTAKRRGIACIGICDHDCVMGLEQTIAAGEKQGIEVVPGIEVTAEHEGHEIHILGYFIDWRDPKLIEFITHMRKIRVNRIYEMVRLLNKRGINVSAKEVFIISGKGSVGRLHLALAIHRKGHTRYPGEAFKLYIGEGKPCYVGMFNITPEEAITTIIEAGGVPVLAHPGVAALDRFIPEYVKSGLKGIEVYHTDHSTTMKKHYLKLAESMNLIVTGGSDCHGLGKGQILLGKITVDYAVVEELRRQAGRSDENRHLLHEKGS